MNTSVRSKFTALALALVANSVLMGSVAYLFSAQPAWSVPVVASASTSDTAAVA